MIRKGDFRGIPLADQDAFKAAMAQAATLSALSNFGGINPILRFHLKGKAAYRIRTLSDEIVVRKLALNIKKITKPRRSDRSDVVSNLCRFLEEGVPYRIYRLDVKGYYESFKHSDIRERLLTLPDLCPLDRRHLDALLGHFSTLGGTGLPRGMAISAIVSDALMADFDSWVLSNPSVYFFGRYVDDIVIVTNLTEDQSAFLGQVKDMLPDGLVLNEKKLSVSTLGEKPQQVKASLPLHKCDVDYLGYRFSVFDPLDTSIVGKKVFRLVSVEITPSKVERFKTRIVRSFRDFNDTIDSGLLVDRVKFLTSNFSVYDKNTCKRKLAGIYYGYPLLSASSESLDELDKFLRNAVLSSKGRVFKKSAAALPSTVKRMLLSLSFRAGHRERRFVHFSSSKIRQIQECWKYE
jgi:hypothetical protein